VIARTLPAPCVNRCQLGGTVYPGQKWHVGHIIDKAYGGTDTLDNFGAAHARCNQSDGGKIGAARTNAQRKIRRGFLAW
jgi:5-methylcytosine-specific restriction endonuclease McrA